jgi:hypothetical protein
MSSHFYSTKIVPPPESEADALKRYLALMTAIGVIPLTPELEADAFSRYVTLLSSISSIPITPELEADAAKRYAAITAAIAAIPITPELEADALKRYEAIVAAVSAIPTTPELEADALTRYTALAAAVAAIPTTPELEADAQKRYTDLEAKVSAIPTTPELEASALARYNALTGLVDEVEPIIKVYEFETGFPSSSALDTIADATGGVDTTELTITPSMPSGAVRIRVELIAVITILNNSATAHKIDIDVKGQKGAGAFQTFFSQDSVVGFGNTDGATVEKVITQDVTSLVDTIDGATTYDWKLTVKSSAAGSLKVTTMYAMIVTWRRA